MMATSEDIERKLICSICIHLLREPKLLTCGHTFCQQCLNAHICHTLSSDAVQNHLGFLCPMCRDFIPAPDCTSTPLSWAKLYKTNFIVQDLLDIHQENKETRSPCYAHPGKSLELFCRNCSLPLCDRCVSLQHRSCSDIVDMTTVIREQLAIVDQHMVTVNSMIVQCNAKLRRCQTGIEELDRIEQEVAEKIDRESFDVIKKLTSHVLKESSRLKREVKGQCDIGRAMVRSYATKGQELRVVLEKMKTYLTKKSNEIKLISPTYLDEEARLVKTLATLHRAVDALNNPCHFEVGLSLDDSALKNALADLHLGDVFTLQVSDNIQKEDSRNKLAHVEYDKPRSNTSSNCTHPQIPSALPKMTSLKINSSQKATEQSTNEYISLEHKNTDYNTQTECFPRLI